MDPWHLADTLETLQVILFCDRLDWQRLLNDGVWRGPCTRHWTRGSDGRALDVGSWDAGKLSSQMVEVIHG